ncbi:hypothetical protein ACGC1H_005000 [Rhizoctonia solani]
MMSESIVICRRVLDRHTPVLHPNVNRPALTTGREPSSRPRHCNHDRRVQTRSRRITTDSSILLEDYPLAIIGGANFPAPDNADIGVPLGRRSSRSAFVPRDISQVIIAAISHISATPAICSSNSESFSIHEIRWADTIGQVERGIGTFYYEDSVTKAMMRDSKHPADDEVLEVLEVVLCGRLL